MGVPVSSGGGNVDFGLGGVDEHGLLVNNREDILCERVIVNKVLRELGVKTPYRTGNGGESLAAGKDRRTSTNMQGIPRDTRGLAENSPVRSHRSLVGIVCKAALSTSASCVSPNNGNLQF